MGLSFAEIKAAYEREQAQAGKVWHKEQIPLAWDFITPEWLSDALIGAGKAEKIVGYRLDERDEGTASRRRIFLEYNAAGQAAGLPATVFGKSTQHLENRFIIGMNGGIEAEVTFYQAVRPKLDIEAPRALFARFDASSLNSIILLHDMRDEVTFCPYDQPMTLELAKSQMRVLATLHAAYYQSPELTTTLAPWNTWEDYFAITAKEAGFEQACQRGFAEARDVVPPALFAHEAEIWPATVEAIALHSRLPRMLVHSDVHLKNWYVAAPDRMGLTDWQCSCKGHWSRDLSYCISTALTVEQRRAWEKELLTYYLELMHAKGVPAIAFDDAWLAYRAQMFPALAWWTGTLGQPPEAPAMQPRAASLTFIERMANAVHDLDSLRAVREAQARF
ncbi:MAG: aminoglycoside phosphotransferase family protein [Gammaproteobacteria bacterium]|nr:aminoglycoside phosphotransferase family protein [Gammaproteobacteria bacterium]